MAGASGGFLLTYCNLANAPISVDIDCMLVPLIELAGLHVRAESLDGERVLHSCIMSALSGTVPCMRVYMRGA